MGPPCGNMQGHLRFESTVCSKKKQPSLTGRLLFLCAASGGLSSFAPDTEFEGGLYHGIIKLPMSYPNRPPNIMFLTPNGRFDINMDVCLSMTKYHKEEWQAAWTIRSMLEAIIAFFPVKEDHDAIGAIDSSVESRKHFAKLSLKYKCDTCGPIANLLKPIEKMENSDKNNNGTDNKNNSGNNNSGENKNNKNIKVGQFNIKKEADSSSNSSLASNQTGKFKFKRDKTNSNNNNNIVINKKENEKDIIKEKEIIINNNTNDININNDINIINNNNNNNESNNINSNINNRILNNINIDSEQNQLIKSIYDDIEYLDIKKSIQFHENKTNEEIESKLFKNKSININKFNNNLNLFNLKNLFEKDDQEENKNEEYSGNNNIAKMFKNNLINEKDFCEKQLEENIKYIKYFSRKNYEDIRDKNKKKVMFVMIGIMISILILYIVGNKFSNSFNRILKALLLP